MDPFTVVTTITSLVIAAATLWVTWGSSRRASQRLKYSEANHDTPLVIWVITPSVAVGWTLEPPKETSVDYATQLQQDIAALRQQLNSPKISADVQASGRAALVQATAALVLTDRLNQMLHQLHNDGIKLNAPETIRLTGTGY
jgi:hypothetical protein